MNTANSFENSGRHSFPRGGLVDISRATYKNVRLSVTEIRPRILTVANGGGTVTAIAGSKGYAVIDTGFGPRVDEIRSHIVSALQQPPRWLINTHWHFDHTDGNSVFSDEGTTVIAHANCRARLSQDQFVPSLEWSVRSAPHSAWPALTFKSPIEVDLGTQVLKLIPQNPAHTDGDIVAWLPESNVIVMGDLMTNGSYPVIDESSQGSLRGMIQAIEQVLPLVNAETVVVPGHGPMANRESLLSFHEMLTTVERRIHPLIVEQLPVSEILASSPIGDLDLFWGRGYVTGSIFLRMVLAGLGLTETMLPVER
jgi:cyclase